jgi:hypothetical protein
MLTIITPATDPFLISASDIAQELPDIPAAKREGLARRASAAIAAQCGIARSGAAVPTLRLETVQDTFRLKSHQGSLVLSRKPVVSVASVVENGVTVDVADYEVDATHASLGKLSSDALSCWLCGKIVVTYTAGWEVVPDDLRRIALELAAAFHSDATIGDSNLRSMEIPGVYSETRWVDNTDVSPIPPKLVNALADGGYVVRNMVL